MFKVKALVLSMLLVPSIAFGKQEPIVVTKQEPGVIENAFVTGTAVAAFVTPITIFCLSAIVATNLVVEYIDNKRMRAEKKAAKIKLNGQVADLKDQMHCLHHELENVADRLQDHIDYAEQA